MRIKPFVFQDKSANLKTVNDSLTVRHRSIDNTEQVYTHFYFCGFLTYFYIIEV